jgi:deoxyribodipyrimidine photo-lyase
MPQAARVLIYLLRRDLRVVDNPVLHEIARLNSQSQKPFTHLLPLYVFSAEQIEISGFLSADDKQSPYPQARSRVGGFWRCGRLRAKFLAESVWEMRKNLEALGSGLEIRVGSVADAVQSVLDGFRDQDGVEVHGLWMTSEEGWEEKIEEQRVEKLLDREEKEFKLWTDEKYFVDE